MNTPNQSLDLHGTVPSKATFDVRARAMEVLTRRRVTEWQLRWVIAFSALSAAVLGWLMFPEHYAVGGMAAIGWSLAILSLQQCAQLRRDVNALISLTKLGGPSGD